MQIETGGGVFAPTHAAKLVIKAIGNDEFEKDKKALDLGTGTGVFAIYLALNGYKDVLAVDRHKTSLECAEKNAKLNNVEDKIEFRKSNFFSEIKPDEKFGLVLTNPSDLPEGIWKNPNDKNMDIDKELIAGKRGNEVVLKLAENIDNLMTKGRVIFLCPTFNNIEHIKQIYTKKGFGVKVVSRTVHKLSYWPFDEWKYDLNLMLKKWKEFEKEEKGNDYIIYEDNEPCMVIEIVEAKRD
jgi:methylase of polypeptide subunit release factors